MIVSWGFVLCLNGKLSATLIKKITFLKTNDKTASCDSTSQVVCDCVCHYKVPEAGFKHVVVNTKGVDLIL